MPFAALLCAVLGIPAAPAASAVGEDPGNILILLADDIGVDVLRVYGLGLPEDTPPTPVLDSLAARGVMFRNAWANPICSPSRAAFHTGRHSFRTGVGTLILAGSRDRLLPEEVLLPEMLELGTGGRYQSALLGKWHLVSRSGQPGEEAHPNAAGYPHFAGPLANLKDYWHWTKVVNGQSFQHDAYALSDKVDDAVAWIQARSAPWMCAVSFSVAHKPYHLPPDDLHGYDLPPPDESTEDYRPYYNAMVEAMDTEIGRLLAAIGPGLEDTTVVFLADNGTPVEVTRAPFDPEHAKGTRYDGGVHVPLLVAGREVPEASHGAESSALVSIADVFATAADFARVDLGKVMPPNRPLDSISFAPSLRDPAAPSVRRTLFAERFSVNGPAHNGFPFIGCTCQEDIGFGGPGSVRLSVCGRSFVPLGDTYVGLSAAPADAPVLLLIGSERGAIPLFGGIIVPYPPTFVLSARAGPGGALLQRWTVPDVPPFGEMYFQALVADPLQVHGFAISNAVAAQFDGFSFKRVGDGEYAYVADILNLSRQEFYDLRADPMEKVNLLADPAGLSPAERDRLERLRTELYRVLDVPSPDFDGNGSRGGRHDVDCPLGG